jgi:hypothetical protein
VHGKSLNEPATVAEIVGVGLKGTNRPNTTADLVVPCEVLLLVTEQLLRLSKAAFWPAVSLARKALRSVELVLATDSILQGVAGIYLPGGLVAMFQFPVTAITATIRLGE